MFTAYFQLLKYYKLIKPNRMITDHSEFTQIYAKYHFICLEVCYSQMQVVLPY